MGAAASVVLAKPLTQLDSGSVVTTALGSLVALAVVIAGWTTANPMLYRSGLAFQVVSPGWPRWRVTLIAGVLTTIFACSLCLSLCGSSQRLPTSCSPDSAEHGG